jgi:putative flippase GtrA
LERVSERTAPPGLDNRRARFWQWIRHHTAALIATAADFLTMVACVELAGVRPVPATALGALVGGITNFTINRHYTYHATQMPVGGQVWRFALVSGTSLGLNTAGEALFHNVLGVQYLLARVIVATLVSNGWNYPMLKYFVFKLRPPAADRNQPS